MILGTKGSKYARLIDFASVWIKYYDWRWHSRRKSKNVKRNAYNEIIPALRAEIVYGDT